VAHGARCYCVCFGHVQLLYNAALKFDATFSVLVFPLDVGKRFARLITHALREVPHCGLD
jgi:hypothetical protein